MPELLLQDREYSKHLREAHLLHRTVASERREGGRVVVVAVPMIPSPGIDSFGISINSCARAAISSGRC